MRSRKQHDTSDPPFFTLGDKNGPVNLITATSVSFIMAHSRTGVVKVDALCVVDPDQDTNTGQCSYQWVPADVDTIGAYDVELRVIWPNGRQATFPNGTYEHLQILKDLDGV